MAAPKRERDWLAIGVTMVVILAVVWFGYLHSSFQVEPAPRRTTVTTTVTTLRPCQGEFSGDRRVDERRLARCLDALGVK
jgi:hypothetical protein